MLKIAVLVSGGGSNLQSIIDAIKQQKINASVSVVIGSKNDIFALERARNENIPTKVVNKSLFPNPSDEILNIARQYGVDLIVLAGYLSMLQGKLLDEFRNRIINIHPSLIPDFCGEGMYGHFVHEAVFNAGAKKSGCTVHYVTEKVDGGSIILQKEIDLEPTDTPDIIAKKVLILEHLALPEAISIISKQKE